MDGWSGRVRGRGCVYVRAFVNIGHDQYVLYITGQKKYDWQDNYFQDKENSRYIYMSRKEGQLRSSTFVQLGEDDAYLIKGSKPVLCPSQKNQGKEPAAREFIDGDQQKEQIFLCVIILSSHGMIYMLHGNWMSDAQDQVC